jgi:hypothetical protein
MYGLKQVPRAWYNRFATYITSLEFVEAKSDTFLFVFGCGTYTVYLLVYVDDIILIATLLQQTISTPKYEFVVEDLRLFHHFGGGRGSSYNIRWTGSSSLSVSLLSIFLRELAWWTGGFDIGGHTSQGLRRV